MTSCCFEDFQGEYMDGKRYSTKVSHIEYKETGKSRFRCRKNKSFILVLEIIGIRFIFISLNNTFKYAAHKI